MAPLKYTGAAGCANEMKGTIKNNRNGKRIAFFITANLIKMPVGTFGELLLHF